MHVKSCMRNPRSSYELNGGILTACGFSALFLLGLGEKGNTK